MKFWKFEILEKCPGSIFQIAAKKMFLKMPPLSGSKFPLLAIHKIISHIWEDGSRKVNNDEPDLRFLSRKLLICYKPCRSKTLFFDLNPKGKKFHISRCRRLRRRVRRRTNSQIQIQAPANAPRDEILPQGKPSLLTGALSVFAHVCFSRSYDIQINSNFRWTNVCMRNVMW